MSVISILWKKWRTAFGIAKRESKKSLIGFRVFIASLVLGVFAISAVGSMSSSVISSLQKNAKTILGGDIEISQRSLAIEQDVITWIKNNSLVISYTTEMRTMARAVDSKNPPIIVELKAIDDNYPLYGKLITSSLDENSHYKGESIFLGKNYILTELLLLKRLSLKIGDSIILGNKSFVIQGTIKKEPDRVAGWFNLGPRILISKGSLTDAGLNESGSLVRHNIRVKIDKKISYKNWEQEFKTFFPNETFRIKNSLEAQPAIKEFIQRLETILTLSSIVALLIGGIGVGNAVTSYLERKISTIATLKVVGASGASIFQIYFLQVSAIALLGIAIGLFLGSLTPLFVFTFLGKIFPIPIEASIHLLPLTVAAIYGILITLIFSIWPLAIAREVPPAILFRTIVEPRSYRPKFIFVAIIAILVTVLITLAVFSSMQSFIAQWFVLGTIAALAIFYGASSLLLHALRNMNFPSGRFLRLALSGIIRPGAPSKNIILSFGTGLTLLIGIAAVQSNLNNQITGKIPSIAPSFFFVDVQKHQMAELEKTLRATNGFIRMETVPNLRSRLVRIADMPIDKVDLPREGAWIKRHDFGATFAANPPSRANIVSGEWWSPDYRGQPMISVDRDLARTMGVKIGDTLTFNILGREITATIKNLRFIDWGSDLGINFFVVFSPRPLDNAPYTYLATASILPKDEPLIYRIISSDFPNVTIIRVKEIIAAVAQLLSQISLASTGVSTLTVLAGILVLAGSINAGYQRRVYDAVILKVLGATPSDLLRIYLIEFLLLGFLTALLAWILGNIIAWLVVKFLFTSGWQLFPLPTIFTALGGIAGMLILGLISTWTVLHQRPAPILRIS